VDRRLSCCLHATSVLILVCWPVPRSKLPRSAPIVMISVRIEPESGATARADDAYARLEDGVMDAGEGTHPWITEDIPAGRIR
jgi:hypothetical protein